jgi:FkbM family methyltransferase
MLTGCPDCMRKLLARKGPQPIAGTGCDRHVARAKEKSLTGIEIHEPSSASKIPRNRARAPAARRTSPLRNLRGKWEYLKTQHGFRRAPVLTMVRLLGWLSRCFLQKAVTVNLRRWGVKMLLPGDWRGLGKFLYVFRENYEPELAELEKFLSPGKIFVDVGANVGIYTLVASKLVGAAGRVLAFEPTPQTFAGLRRNIALNRLGNVLTFPVALSEETGTAWLYYGSDPVRNSLGRDPCTEGECERVALESLDQVLQQAGVEHVDVLKIDAEGAEELVLRGAEKLLTSSWPVVIYEVNPQASSYLGLSKDGATKLLERRGYEFFVQGGPGASCAEELSPGYFNVVAIPRRLE